MTLSVNSSDQRHATQQRFTAYITT